MSDQQIKELAARMSVPEFTHLAAEVMGRHFGPARYGAVTWHVANGVPDVVVPLTPDPVNPSAEPARLLLRGLSSTTPSLS